MKRKREEIKAELMSQFEQWVEKALESGESPLSLTEIEDLSIEVKQQVGEKLLQGLAEQQLEQDAVEIPSCPTCGKRMHPKGSKGRYLRTRTGEVRVEREYYYCRACQSGLFPP